MLSAQTAPTVHHKLDIQNAVHHRQRRTAACDTQAWVWPMQRSVGKWEIRHPVKS